MTQNVRIDGTLSGMALFRRRRDLVVPSPSAWPESLSPRHDPAADRVHDSLRAAGVTIPPLQRLSDDGAPSPVLGCVLEAGDPVAVWQAVRNCHEVTGYWPVLLGELESIGETLSFAGGDTDPDELRRGRELDAAAWLREHDPRSLVAPDEADFAAPEDYDLAVAELGPLEILPPAFAGAVTPTVLALVEAPAGGYEVPARVSWSGAVNSDVLGDVHLAVLRRWYEAHGAELVVLGFDTLELSIARPPVDPELALAVGREQYAYCVDVIDQGAETLRTLVREQVARRSWYFWWD